MLSLLVALLQPVTPPDLATVDRLPMAESAQLVLGDTKHGPIVAVVKGQPGQPSSPGEAVREYLEAPKVSEGGCARRRWRAEFALPRWDATASYTDERGDATLMLVTGSTEVAVRSSRNCPTNGYVRMHESLTIDEAFSALRIFAMVQSGEGSVTILCWERTRTVPCASRAEALAILAGRTPDTISRGEQGVDLGLSRGDGTIVSMRVDPRKPESVEITRPVFVVS